MKKKVPKATLLWVDLEMTGLDPKQDRILEVAAIATDWKLNEFGTFLAAVKVDEKFQQNEKNSPKIYQTDGEFIIFQNAYASWSQTVPVLQRALTEQSQYNQKEFYESISIIDAAKKAGYKTFWFSIIQHKYTSRNNRRR